MSKLFFLGAVLGLSWATTALAQSPGPSLLRPDNPTANTTLAKPAPRTRTTANPCAAYGPSFARVPGTDTCLKVGGAASVEAGSSLRR